MKMTGHHLYRDLYFPYREIYREDGREMEEEMTHNKYSS
jgi:hypothetical protein